MYVTYLFQLPSGAFYYTRGIFLNSCQFLISIDLLQNCILILGQLVLQLLQI